jgi:hypothetical protein
MKYPFATVNQETKSRRVNIIDGHRLGFALHKFAIEGRLEERGVMVDETSVYLQNCRVSIALFGMWSKSWEERRPNKYQLQFNQDIRC